MNFAVVLDFGYTDDPDVHSSIYDLGDRMLGLDNYDSYTILAQSATYAYLSKRAPDLVSSGQLFEIGVAQSGSENGGGLEDGGSYHVLKRAKEMIDEMDHSSVKFTNVLIFAHKLHTPRALKQAELLGFDAPMSGGNWCPTKLYSAAAQWWCRNAVLWHLRELVGYIPLKLAGQI